MTQHEQIAAFIEALTDYDGLAPFSDAKLPIEPDAGMSVVVAENDTIMALGATAHHVQSDATVHGELETAVLPVMRFPEFEGAVLDASTPLVDSFDSFSVWSRRSTLDSALDERGFVLSRTLDYFVVDLPLDSHPTPPPDDRIKVMQSDDLDGMLRVNRAAFDGHREAAALDAPEMHAYMSESWFDPNGILVADEAGVVGYCWTKVHANGDGEIFRIAVHPEHQGSGFGVALLHAGFKYLASLPSVTRGVLWVDRSNTAALRLYRSVGMELERSNREFTQG